MIYDILNLICNMFYYMNIFTFYIIISSYSLDKTIILLNSLMKKYNFESKKNIDEDEKCAICLSIISKNINVTILSCNHMYCSTCIIQWSRNNNTCPKCRKSILHENNNNTITNTSFRMRRRNAVILDSDDDYLRFIASYQNLDLPDNS